MFSMNFAFGLGAIYYLNWRIQISVHGIAGTALSVLMTVGAFEGMMAKHLFRNIRWNNALLIKIQYSHKVNISMNHPITLVHAIFRYTCRPACYCRRNFKFL